MGVDVRVSIEIDRPAAEVFDFVADVGNNPRWQNGMVSCEWTTLPPVAVGSEYRQEARFLGRPVRTTFEVVDYQPGRTVTIDSRESTFPITVTRTVEPTTDDRSRVSAHIRGGPTGLLALLSPITTRMVQSSVTKDYERLKTLLEGEDG